MVCPYRKITETVDGTTREYFMDCYGTECPCYIVEQYFLHGSAEIRVPAYCKRAVNEKGD